MCLCLVLSALIYRDKLVKRALCDHFHMFSLQVHRQAQSRRRAAPLFHRQSLVDDQLDVNAKIGVFS